MEEQWIRTQMLLGENAMAILRRSHIAVFGLGGVGSYAVEALARSGIGELTVIDDDTIAVSNLNRQLPALQATIGRKKADVVAERIAAISPQTVVHPMALRYEAACREDFFAAEYDYIIDAIDTVSSKLDLIQTALERQIPIVSALGTGNKLDPTLLSITDISKTYNCPLARVMRKELKARGIYRLPVLFSSEVPRKPAPLAPLPPGRRSLPASVAWVPGCGGLILAGYVVQELVKEAGV